MLYDKQPYAYALFRDEPAAARAVEALIEADFDSEDIDVVMRREAETEKVPLKHKTGIVPGAITGCLLGALLGALLLPLTPVITVGGAKATLGGAFVGFGAGTLMGALAGLGFWKKKLAVPMSSFAHGGVLVGARASNERADVARNAFRAAGAAETSLSSLAEAQSQLPVSGTGQRSHPGAPVNPDKLARNVFLLTLAYVVAVGASIWLFIRPV